METNQERSFSVSLLWRILRKNWIVIVVIALVVAVATGVIYGSLYTPIYSSQTQYYVSNVSEETFLYTDSQTSGAASMAAYCAELMMTQRVLESVLQEAELTEAERATLTVDGLRKMITAKSQAAMITVSVAGPDPSLNYRLSKTVERVLPAYCDFYNNQNKNQDEPISFDKESLMVKITDYSVQDDAADNAISLVKNPLLAFALTFVLVYVVFFVLAWLDQTVYSKLDLLEKLPNITIFGVIPHWEITKGDGKKKKRCGKQKKSNERDGVDERLLTAESVPSGISESFRHLATNVTFCSSEEKGCTVGVVSALAASGKSFIMANLAVSLSQRIGKKVLLVDADMRCPMQHQIFRLENKVGLSNLLAGQDTGDAFNVMEDGALTVLTAGVIPPNPVELLTSPKMQTLMEEWKQTYDYILVDLPPVGEVSDAVAISKLMSGYLFVLRSGRSDARMVFDASAMLEEKQAKVLGYVLTDVEKEYLGGYYGYKGYKGAKYYYYTKRDRTEASE